MRTFRGCQGLVPSSSFSLLSPFPATFKTDLKSLTGPWHFPQGPPWVNTGPTPPTHLSHWLQFIIIILILCAHVRLGYMQQGAHWPLQGGPVNGSGEKGRSGLGDSAAGLRPPGERPGSFREVTTVVTGRNIHSRFAIWGCARCQAQQNMSGSWNRVSATQIKQKATCACSLVSCILALHQGGCRAPWERAWLWQAEELQVPGLALCLTQLPTGQGPAGSGGSNQGLWGAGEVGAGSSSTALGCGLVLTKMEESKSLS